MADTAEMYLVNALSQVPEARRAELQMSFRAQKKDRTVALLLSLFLGGLGIDRMYVGDLGLGICKLLFNWATCFLWAFVDLFLIMGAADRHNMAVIDRLVAMYRAPTS